ncbi:MAG: hypothetical protein DI551_01695 [Micavibrio aeruginosavorus]|uniref:Uncharacterized protein n=1 Tax=Micavibrio aeruginosavorus TaxID=349221 RepID=A0A2W5PTY5_9BACT|nr:MAG: hypothetical protein DI551_01695 [Micavibrio aeruginosavorus]
MSSQTIAAAPARFLSRHWNSLLLGSCSSAACHVAHYGLAAGTGLLGGLSQGNMAGLSAVFFVASYAVWHRFLGGHLRSARSQAGAFVMQAGISAAVFAGVQMMAPHDHMKGAQAEWYQSLPPEMKRSLLAGSRKSYENLPADLRERLDIEAEKAGIPPELFMVTCGGDNQVSRDIAAYAASRRTSVAPKPGGPK